jgi:phospholipase/carboxylesterase
MKKYDLSLVHNVREPLKRSSEGTPVLLQLHGIGSNEDDLFGLSPYLDEQLMIISIRAPLEIMPGAFAWFNIEYGPNGIIANIPEAKKSLELLQVFLNELERTYGLESQKFLLMGFSQGAMMATALTLSLPQRVSGLAALSGRFPEALTSRAEPGNGMKEKPVLLAHGVFDPVIPIEFGRDAQQHFARMGSDLFYHEYPMGHEINQASLNDLARWISERVAEQS